MSKDDNISIDLIDEQTCGITHKDTIRKAKNKVRKQISQIMPPDTEKLIHGLMIKIARDVRVIYKDSENHLPAGELQKLLSLVKELVALRGKLSTEKPPQRWKNEAKQKESLKDVLMELADISAEKIDNEGEPLNKDL